jgi:hypothetical protein
MNIVGIASPICDFLPVKSEAISKRYLIPSEASGVMSKFAVSTGSLARFSPPDIVTLSELGYLSLFQRPPYRRVVDAVEFIRFLEEGGLPTSEAVLSQIEQDAALKRAAERRAKTAYELVVTEKAEELVKAYVDRPEFHADLERAIAETIAKHYATIPSVVAKIMARDTNKKLKLRSVIDKYGTHFTGALLDKLTEPWIQRVLARDGGRVNADLVKRAVRWVGSVQQGRSTVYLVKPTGLRVIKIGIAGENVDARLGGLQTGCPFPVHLILTFPGGKIVEEKIHEVFHNTRLMGEWFVLDETMKEFIRQARSKLNRVFAMATNPKKRERLGRHIAYIDQRCQRERFLEEIHLSSKAHDYANELETVLETELVEAALVGA